MTIIRGMTLSPAAALSDTIPAPPLTCAICGQAPCYSESCGEWAGILASHPKLPTLCPDCGCERHAVRGGMRCPVCAIRSQVTPTMARLGAALTQAIVRGPAREMKGAA